MMSTTDFNTILSDLKYSLKLAWNKALSYFLADLGMLFVIAIIFGIVAIPLAIAAFLVIGPHNFAALGVAVSTWAAANPWLVGGIAMLFVIPIITLFFMVIGSIYGMSKELVETGDTRAELAFSYFRHKFIPFASAGVLLTLIIIVPPIAVWGATSILSGYVISYAAQVALSVFTFVWVFITVGLCAMVLPAVVNGKGVQEAFKESFSLAINRFDRVFGLLCAVILLAVAMFSPIIIGGVTVILAPDLALFSFNPFSPFFGGMIAVMIWTVVSVFLWLLVLLPMTIISFVKVYAELTGGQIAAPSTPDMPIV
jgi:hypothetical protein